MADDITKAETKFLDNSLAPIAETVSVVRENTLYGHVPKGAPASKKEVISYYTYYAANNGIGCFQ